jgi:hypothetical protein
MFFFCEKIQEKVKNLAGGLEPKPLKLLGGQSYNLAIPQVISLSAYIYL